MPNVGDDVFNVSTLVGTDGYFDRNSTHYSIIVTRYSIIVTRYSIIVTRL